MRRSYRDSQRFFQDWGNMDVTIRPVDANEFEPFVNAVARGFAEELSSEELEHERRTFEPERSLAAFDDGTIVGTTGAYSMQMKMPGGITTPIAGVTAVTVAATHRRRGILTRMMRRQLESLRDTGEPLAALWASESVIYGRFGYGLAIPMERWSIDRRHTAFAHSPSPAGRLRFVDKQEAKSLLPPVLDTACEIRPGMMRRSELGWEGRLRDPEHEKRGASPLFFVVHETDAVADGYAIYRVKHAPEDSDDGGHAHVTELVSTTDAAHAALWGLCFNLDLVSGVDARSQPTDDAVPWMLADPRRLCRRPYDGIWLRLVNVPDALSLREYGDDAPLVIRVSDRFCEWNEGVFRLQPGASGAQCEATDASPDLSLSAADLAAVFLGGVKPSVLARAGRAQEDSPGSLRRADALFSTPIAPWCVVDF